jgi:DNA-3-methyladenine glycosylase I
MTDYVSIFHNAELTLKQHSWFTEEEFENVYGRFKEFETKARTDDEYFEMLIMIVFYSGFKAATVEEKEGIILGHFPNYKQVADYSEVDVHRILSDSEMIKNERKITACISNAKSFKKIIQHYGSFLKYLEAYNAKESFVNLVELKNDLMYRFHYLGDTTVNHFLTDLGYNVLKPDRVISRIFRRLGLIDDEKRILHTIEQGKEFAKQTRYPIRYIDIIFVKLGQQGKSKMFGLADGICLEKSPSCSTCLLKEYCTYYKQNPTINWH